MDQEETILPIGKKSVFMISAICLIAVLTLLVVNVFMRASVRPGHTILPGGVTYLGPTP